MSWKKKSEVDENQISLNEVMYHHILRERIVLYGDTERTREDFKIFKEACNKAYQALYPDRDPSTAAFLTGLLLAELDCDGNPISGASNSASEFSKKIKSYLPKRTKAKQQEAGAITEAPDKLRLITLKSHQSALSFSGGSEAGLVISDKDIGLAINGGMIGKAEIKHYKDKNVSLRNFDTAFLTYVFSIIHSHYTEEYSNLYILENGLDFDKTVAISAQALTQNGHPTERDIESTITKIKSFEQLRGDTRNGVYNVLSFDHYDKRTNIFYIKSPYLVFLYSELISASIRRTKKDEILVDKKGEPKKVASISYLINSNITKERNKGAAAIVFVIVRLIEQAGGRTPHITAQGIIDYVPELQEQLMDKARQDQNKILKGTFQKAFELLRTKTDLEKTYKNIELPGELDYPTMATLDRIYTFKHEGKAKK